MRSFLVLLSWLLVFFPFACSGTCSPDDPDPTGPSTPPPSTPADLPTPTLSCPDWPGDDALPEMKPLEPAPGANVGAVDGSFDISSAGSATYTIPLSIPPGRQLEPRLAITYDSSSGVGLLGKGFSLAGLSSIYRCGSSLAQDGDVIGLRLDGRDHFCMDAARLVEVRRGKDQIGSFAEYRTFPDTQRKVIAYGAPKKDAFDPDYFLSWERDGRVIEYGKSADRRVTWRSGVTRSWSVEREIDRHGNTIRYSYESDIDNATGTTLEHVPIKIQYTGHIEPGGAETAGDRSILFRYEKLDQNGA